MPQRSLILQGHPDPTGTAFCHGIKPIRETLFGLVESVSNATRQQWLEQMHALGRADASGQRVWPQFLSRTARCERPVTVPRLLTAEVAVAEGPP